MFDIRPYLSPEDPWPATEQMENVMGYYDGKYRAAALVRARSILEIGVRAGYSAAAFLSACPGASYTGIDADINRHGGREGLFAWARETLPRSFPESVFAFHTADSRHLSRLPGERYDLIHVDGDHSYEGCVHDLTLAAEQARWILADDVTWVPEVGAAVHGFLAQTRFGAVLIPGWRGEMLIQVKQ